MKKFHTLLWSIVLSAVFAEGLPFSRYQTIIDRKPFGPEPANFDPDAMPGTSGTVGDAGDGEMTPEQRTAEEQQLAANVRVSILNVNPAGVVKVGFTDSSVKPPENYYLKVGASQNGWTVKDADPATESVTLAKGGVEVTVKLGESAGGGDGKGKGAGGGRAPSRSPLRGGLISKRSEAGHRMPGGAVGGLARLRQQRMAAIAEEEKRRAADAAAKAEREEREAEERQRAIEEKRLAAEERAQQREALLQIQEQLRKQREEREARREQQGEERSEENDDT